MKKPPATVTISTPPQIGERRKDSDALDQSGRHRAVTRAPAPNPPTANPVSGPRRSGKPLDEHGDGHGVRKPEPDAADHAVCQVQPPEPMVRPTARTTPTP